ncbi:hypothetical protein [Kribbella solani]|uniref:hypothetical protein n=1 Tax=Kribbella solani TaxID=236067 RepID=UPI0029B8BAA0|nr:hypothetical protein [Kribbella solani]MDX2974754.1 hypothetical protein [Kribbella solani]
MGPLVVRVCGVRVQRPVARVCLVERPGVLARGCGLRLVPSGPRLAPWCGPGVVRRDGVRLGGSVRLAGQLVLGQVLPVRGLVLEEQPNPARPLVQQVGALEEQPVLAPHPVQQVLGRARTLVR